MTTICRKIEYGSEEFFEAAKLRFQVCCVELGWFDPSSYPDQQETDEYDQFAKHFGVYDCGQLIGYSRLITGVNEYPTERHSHEISYIKDFNRCEVSRLIVDKTYRKNTAALILISRIYEEVVALDMVYAISLIEPTLLRLLKRLGIPFKEAGSVLKNVLGADILIPCVVKVSEIDMMAEVVR